MIYLDNNATTRPADAVIDAVLVAMRDNYTNPSAIAGGVTGADKPRTAAAGAMARLIGAEEPDCIFFTSGATESNNWVFGPIVEKCAERTVVISAVEHPSVAEPAEALRARGFRVSVVGVDQSGRLKLDDLASALDENVALVSIMAANNETGIVQPIEEIGRLIRGHSPAALFHTDATQALGKIRIDVQEAWGDVDLISFSAHKFHGPRGIGGLYVRPGIEITPMLLGGGQESGMRSGTTNVPALAGLAKAAELAAERAPFTSEFRDAFEANVRDAFPDVVIHSSDAERLPNTTCISFPGTSAEDVALALAHVGVVVGTGAACSSGSMAPPKTLIAMGVPYDLANAAIRISTSRATTEVEIQSALAALKRVIAAKEDIQSSVAV